MSAGARGGRHEAKATTLSLESMAARVVISLVQGVVLWRLFEIVSNELWPQSQRGWLVGLIAVGVLVPLAHYLIADLARPARQWPVLAGLALLSLGLGWHHGHWTTDDPYHDFLSFPAALGVLVLHALPFVQSALESGTTRLHYATLYRFAWRNALLGALGAVFAGVFWLLLVLWGQLFHMLGIDLFRDLFESSAFAIPATTVAVGIGVQLAGSVERLQGALRQQLLALLKWLAPLAIFILVLFTVTLLAKSPELFSEQRRAISAVWLLWLVALTVALLNAAYQDGSDENPYPPWLGTAIRFASMLLLPVAALAVYALGVRIANYGLTAPRGWGLLVAMVALGYAGGYAWAAARSGAWMGRMGAVNVAIALFTIAMLTLMLTPLLSPERLAAASQYRRVLADPAGDAYGELRFRTGRYGRDRLAQLATIEGPARAADIRARAAGEMRKTLPGDDSEMEGALDAGDFVAFPAGSRLDPGLIAALGRGAHGRQLAACTEQDPCPILFVDLDADGLQEAVAFGRRGAVAATVEEDTWRVLGRVLTATAVPGARQEPDAVIRALEQGCYRASSLPWQSLEIDGAHYVPLEPADRPRQRGSSAADVSDSRAPRRGCP